MLKALFSGSIGIERQGNGDLAENVTDLTAVEKYAVRTVLASVLAGNPEERIRADFGRLRSARERQAVLCTACRIRKEVAATCQERSDEIGLFLAAHCDLFEAYRSPCMLQDVFGVSLCDLGPSRCGKASKACMEPRRG